MLKKPKSTLKTRKTLEKACDKLWSEIIKERADYKCEVCGKSKNLNSHHVFTRSVKVLRWRAENGVCLCPGCHTLSSTLSAHKAPFEFVEWFKSKHPSRYEKLKLMKTGRFKTSLENLRLLKLALEQELRMP